NRELSLIMPRKSAADLCIVQPDATASSPRLTPPSSLTTAERLEFIALAVENKHLRRTDAPMLAAYCQAITRVAKLARGKDTGPWERAVKTMMLLARSMRLTQQSCTDPKTLARARSRPDVAAIMEELNRAAFDDDDEPVRAARPSSDF